MKIARALYNFQGSSETELSVCAGDEFHVIDHSEDWSWCAASDGSEGYVPSSFIEIITNTTQSDEVYDTNHVDITDQESVEQSHVEEHPTVDASSDQRSESETTAELEAQPQQEEYVDENPCVEQPEYHDNDEQPDPATEMTNETAEHTEDANDAAVTSETAESERTDTDKATEQAQPLPADTGFVRSLKMQLESTENSANNSLSEKKPRDLNVDSSVFAQRKQNVALFLSNRASLAGPMLPFGIKPAVTEERQENHETNATGNIVSTSPPQLPRKTPSKPLPTPTNLVPDSSLASNTTESESGEANTKPSPKPISEIKARRPPPPVPGAPRRQLPAVPPATDQAASNAVATPSTATSSSSSGYSYQVRSEAELIHATNNATSGQSIFIESGDYSVNLTITNDITLHGSNKVTTILRPKNPNKPVVSILKCSATVRGITIQHERQIEGPRRDEPLEKLAAFQSKTCILIEQGRPTIEDTVIEGGFVGIWYTGLPIQPPEESHQPSASIRACHIRWSWLGVLVMAYCKPVITDITVLETKYDGLRVCNNADPVFKNCTVTKAGASSVKIYENAKGTFEDCKFLQSVYANVGITAQSKPTLMRCDISSSEQGGLFIADKSAGLIVDCNISNNAYSNVEITTQGDPVFMRTQICSSKLHGVYVLERGRGRFEDCNIYKNELTNVSVIRAGSPTMMRCDIHSSVEGGILVHDGGKGRFEDCKIYNNKMDNIEIRDGGDAAVVRCEIYGSEGHGLIAHHGGKGSFESNNIHDNVLSNDSKGCVIQ